MYSVSSAKDILIDDSIKKNVALGISDSEINERKVEESLDKAQLLELARGFSMGVETKVGESAFVCRVVGHKE